MGSWQPSILTPPPLDPDAVHNRESFFAFVRALVADRHAAVAAETQRPTDPRFLGLVQDVGGWYNFTIESYLDAALAWAESTGMGESQGLPAGPSWQSFAARLVRLAIACRYTRDAPPRLPRTGAPTGGRSENMSAMLLTSVTIALYCQVFSAMGLASEEGYSTHGAVAFDMMRLLPEMGKLYPEGLGGGREKECCLLEELFLALPLGGSSDFPVPFDSRKS